MAAGRRLSELLQEQQEPFLVEAAKIRRPRRGRGGAGGGGGGGACCPVAACQRLLRLCNHGFKKRGADIAGLRSALGKVLCGKAVRSAFRWEGLGAGCFTGVGVGEFRRLRRSAGDSGECGARAMEFDDDDVGDGYGRQGAARWKTEMEVDSSRQLSPVSVLELHSDDESPVHPSWEEDEKPSTSGSSPSPPSSSDFHGPTSPCFTYNLHDDKTLAMETTTEEEDEETAGNHRGGGGRCIEEQISSWERIAGDISRIPAMVELDLSEHHTQQQQQRRQWRGLGPEVREIGARIETLIFEEMRRETVCDMLASHCTFSPTSC